MIGEVAHPEPGLPDGRSWGEIVVAQAHRFPDVLALADEHGGRLDYRELEVEVRRAAACWREAGLRPGDRAAILGRNSVELVVNVLGLAWIGAIPVMLNWRLAPGELAELGRMCVPITVLHDADFHLGAAAVLPAGPRAVMLGRSTTGDPGTSEMRCRATPDAAEQPADGPTIALLHTSGTTGLPKVIALDQQAHIWGCRRLVTMAGMSECDVHLRFTPLFHLAGLQEIGSSLLSGGTTHLQTTFDPEIWLDAVSLHGVTYGHLPPATMQQVVAAFEGRERKPDLSTLREVWYGTAPAGPELVTSALAALGCDLRQVYGMTEAQSPVSILAADDHRPGSPRIGTAGRVLPEWDVRFRGPDGCEVPVGQPGELMVRGRQLFSGYWSRDGAVGAGIDTDGWYGTGDVAVLDADGYLTVVDRVKDMVISGGENIYPAEVERVLSGHPDVKELSVIGVPDDTWGESVHAVIVPHSDADFDSDAFLLWCRDVIAGFKRPRSIDVVDQLPRNASGKVLKRELRARFTTRS